MIILGTNSIKDTGYEVANSCRFNDGDTAYMHRTPSSDGNNQKYTFSAWVKRSNLGGAHHLLTAFYGNLGRYAYYGFDSTDVLVLFAGIYSTGGSTSQSYYLKSKMKFRDVSAWYHIVFAVDSTQGSISNRAKLYVNGTQVDFNTADADYELPGSNEGTYFNVTTSVMQLGVLNSSNDPFDGYMAEVCWIDGTQYAASDFGEFDDDSPTIWKPKDVSGLTFGTNGFYLDFEDSGDLGDDESGQGNDLTEVNLAATDQATDTCTNNFATMNPLNAYYDVCTLSEGNTKYDGNSAVGNYTFTPATMGFSKGKWYWEMKFGSSDTDNWGGIGITSANSTGTTNYLGGSANAYAYYGRTLSGGLGVTYTNNTQTNQGLPFEDGDIIMVAVDCDNLAIYFGKNGTWLNNSSSVTGVPTSGSSKTGAFFSITAPSSTTDGFYFPASGTYSGSQVYPQFLNFGSPAYAISSGNADGNGYGNFEYSVPSGYFSLCTKNLAEFG